MSEEERTTRRTPWLALALGVVAVAYSAAPLGDFVWDDRQLILEQSRVQSLQPISSYFDSLFFGGPAGAPSRSFYRPLVVLSFAVDWQVWGGNPLGFHLTNLLLHLLCVSLVYALARRLGASAAAAGISAALFGTLPRLSEAVAWVSGRTDLLASLFVLAALWAHGERQRRRWLAALLLFGGLLSKEVALAGVAALACWEGAAWLREKEGLKGLLLRGAPLVASVGVYAILRVRAFQAAEALARAPELSTGRRVGLALEAAGTYVAMFLDPLRPRTQIGSVFVPSVAWAVVGAVVVLVAVAGCVGLLWRRKLSAETWGLLLLVVVPLLLVLHLVPLALQVVAADRFLYLPAAAGALLLARAHRSLGAELHRRRAIGGGLVGVLLFAGCTHLRVWDWSDEVSLWSDAVAHAPRGNSLPHLQLALALSRTGRAEEAFPHIEAAEAIEAELRESGSGGDESGPLEARAFAHLALGNFGASASSYGRLAALRPEDPVHAYNHAVATAMGLDFAAADEILGGILRRFPDYEVARNYRRRVRELAAAFAELPPEREGEAESVARRRADLYEALGRTGDARRIRTQLATSD